MSVMEVGNAARNMWEEAASQEPDANEGLTELFSRLLQEEREDFLEKIKQNGTAEPSYQIGASSYTQKQWDRLLKSFDAAQEALRKEAGHKSKKKPAKPQDKYPKDEKQRTGKDCLPLTQTTSCQCGDEDCKQEDKVSLLFTQAIFGNCTEPETEEKIQYVVFYTPEGLFCRKEKGGRVLLEWCIDFDEKNQYEKVAEYAKGLDAKENPDNFSSKDFWQDFLREDKL